MFTSEAEYNHAMSAQAEAEAEYENYKEYLNYLDELSIADPYMYALEVGIDILNNNKFKAECYQAIEILRKEKDDYIKRKNANVNQEEIPDELPF